MIIELGMESTLNPMNNAHDQAEDEAEEHSQLPPGFRFHPTDEELVTYYLTKKILDSNFSGRAIAEADLNKCEPWDLPGKAKMGEKEWYFFSLRDRKYPTGLRTNRATDAGYWKTTGKDREIFNSRSSALVGMKKTLVFYKGRAPKGEKTNWVMHEYRLEGKFSYHRLPKNSKDEWVVCRIFQKSAGGKKTSIGLLSRNAYLDLPGSPSLPSLLESPYNATTLNDQETGSIESESGTNSAKAHVSCFSTAIEYPRTNFTGHQLHQYQRGNSSNYPDSSDQLSEMARFMKQPSYMHNFMLNDPRIQMNMMPAAALFSLSNMRRDQISAMLDQQPGIQQLPVLPPPMLYNSHMALPSNSSNMGYPTDANISALHSSKALVSQSAGSSMEPSSSSGIHHKTLSNDNTMGANNSVGSFQWTNDGLSQKILAQPIQEADGAQCLSTDMNDEMTSVVCNRLDRPLDQLDSSAAPPVDFDSLWNIREHLF